MMYKKLLQQMVSVTFITLFLIMSSVAYTYATEISATPTPSPTPTPTPVPPTPIPEQQSQPESQQDVKALGQIKGILVYRDSDKPCSEYMVDLYLIKGPKDEKGMQAIEKLQQVKTSETGAFIFEQVAPGEYVLTVSKPLEGMLMPAFITTDKDGKPTAIVIGEKQIVDLGKIPFSIKSE